MTTCSHILIRAPYPGWTCSKPTKFTDGQGRPWCAIHAPDHAREFAQRALKSRELFRPKFPELAEQCASCPFRDGNNREWAAICKRLAESAGEEQPAPPMIARSRIRIETYTRGDFICHGSAYNPDMTMRDPKSFRQCPGATQWFKTHLPPKLGKP